MKLTPVSALAALFANVPLPGEDVVSARGGRLLTDDDPADEDPVAGAPVPINQTGVKPGPRKLAQFRQAMELAKVPTKSQVVEHRDERLAYVKLFDPCGIGTWLITDWQPDDNTAFGWVILLGPDCAEWGYFSLDELAHVKGKLGIGIEIDNWFEPQPIEPVIRKILDQ